MAYDRQPSEAAQIDSTCIPCPATPKRRFAVRTNVFLFSIFSKDCCSLLLSLHACILHTGSESFLWGTSVGRESSLRKQQRSPVADANRGSDIKLGMICNIQQKFVIPSPPVVLTSFEALGALFFYGTTRTPKDKQKSRW